MLAGWTADEAGNITVRDLKDNPADQGLADMLRDAELVIPQAAFELRFLGVKLGVIPENVFCTRTADWLLFPKRERIHDLGSVLARHLEVKISKELGGSDWGGMLLTQDQLEYAKNDVRYLLRLKSVLAERLEAAGLARIFEVESRLLPIWADRKCSSDKETRKTKLTKRGEAVGIEPSKMQLEKGLMRASSSPVGATCC
jgi:ribonuclease D